MNCNRHHVSQKPCLIHYFEKLHLGGFLWIWELARGKTTAGIGWTGVGGQEARQPTHLSYWLPEGQSSEALCRQSQCRGERPPGRMQALSLGCGLPISSFHQVWVLSAVQAAFPRSRPRDEVSHHSTRNPICGRDPTSGTKTNLTGWHHPARQKERLYSGNRIERVSYKGISIHFHL